VRLAADYKRKAPRRNDFCAVAVAVAGAYFGAGSAGAFGVVAAASFSLR
jgi:hypothetical protein